jgi:hypothetical protein
VTTLVVLVFTPALLFTNVAASLSAEVVLSWWPIPVFAAMYVVMGLTLALVVTATLGGLPQAQRRWVMVALAFRNTTSIPLALVAQLALTLSILLIDPSDTPAQAAQRGEAYILFYTALISTVRWSLGERLMRRPAAPATVQSSTHDNLQEDHARLPFDDISTDTEEEVTARAHAGATTGSGASCIRRAPSWRDRELSNLMMLSVAPAWPSGAAAHVNATPAASTAPPAGHPPATATSMASLSGAEILFGAPPLPGGIDTATSRDAAMQLGSTDALGDAATAANQRRRRRRRLLRRWLVRFRDGTLHCSVGARV